MRQTYGKMQKTHFTPAKNKKPDVENIFNIGQLLHTEGTIELQDF